MPLVVLHPCAADWEAMAPGAGGRHCDRCSRDVVDATGLSTAQVEQLVSQRAGNCCVRVRADRVVRARSPFETCPTRSGAILAWAAFAAVTLPACSEGRPHPRLGPLDEPSVAGCASPPDDPWAPVQTPRPDSTEICTAAPEAPQCARSAFVAKPHDDTDARLPQHLRADCADIEVARGDVFQGGAFTIERREGPEDTPPPPEQDMRSWPDGLDVVVANMTVEGVPWGSARASVRRLLEPLGRCYSALVARRPSDPAQGQIIVSMSIDSEGAVTDVDVQAADVPGELVECARGALHGAQLGFLGGDYATMALDIRFVHRAPFRTHEPG